MANCTTPTNTNAAVSQTIRLLLVSVASVKSLIAVVHRVHVSTGVSTVTTADRCQILAGVTGGVWLASGVAGFGYVTALLLWWAVIELTTSIRAERRKGKALP